MNGTCSDQGAEFISESVIINTKGKRSDSPLFGGNAVNSPDFDVLIHSERTLRDVCLELFILVRMCSLYLLKTRPHDMHDEF